jgi:hypothetical protein
MPPILTSLLLLTFAGGYFVQPTEAAGDFAATLRDSTGHGALPLALLLMFICDFAILARTIGAQRPVARTIVLWFFVLRVVPLIFDGIRAAATAFDSVSGTPQLQGAAWFAPVSPLGTLTMCLAKDGNPWPGLAVQALITAIFFWMWWRSRPTASVAPARTIGAAAG